MKQNTQITDAEYYANKVENYGKKISDIVYKINSDGEYEFDSKNLPTTLDNKKIISFFIDNFGTYLVIRYFDNNKKREQYTC